MLSTPGSCEPAMADRPAIDAFIFDLGRVIVDWDPRYLLAQIEPDPQALETLAVEVLDLDWFRAVDTGYPLSAAIAVRAELYPAHADALRAYVERWPETIRGIFEDTVGIVDELRQAGFPLYVLSNWAVDTWAMVSHDFDFLRHFDDVVISGHVGLAKPDRRIFELARERFALVPARTMFIDDSEANVAAAQALGFRTIRHETADQLRAELISLGLPLRPPVPAAD